MKWEYKVLTDDAGTVDDDREALDALGDDGWELVAVVLYPETRHSDAAVRWYLRRPKQGEAG